jgi:hypothetical protein
MLSRSLHLLGSRLKYTDVEHHQPASLATTVATTRGNNDLHTRHGRPGVAYGCLDQPDRSPDRVSGNVRACRFARRLIVCTQMRWGCRSSRRPPVRRVGGSRYRFA